MHLGAALQNIWRYGNFETSDKLLLCQVQVIQYSILQQKEIVQISCLLDLSAVVVVPAVMPVSVSVPVPVMARRHLRARAVVSRELPTRVRMWGPSTVICRQIIVTRWASPPPV